MHSLRHCFAYTSAIYLLVTSSINYADNIVDILPALKGTGIPYC